MIDRDKDRYDMFTRRAFLLGAGKIALLAGLGTRLGYLQITEADKYKTLSDKNRINVNLLAPSRGRIYDRMGRVMADNNQNFKVNIVAEQARNVEKTLYELSQLIPLEEHEIDRVLSEVKKVRSFIPVTVKENLDWRDVSKIEVNLPRLSGLVIEEGEMRYYPYSNSTAHLIGYVGLVNRSEIKEQGDPVLTVPGFRIGKTGIEKSLDQDIRGEAGHIKVEVNARGRVVRELEKNYGREGSDINLTIDAEYQNFVQKRLGKEKSASAAIMNPHNGEIYALVSNPSFDPNMFATRIPANEWERLLSNPAVPLTNKAIAGQYPPGSTFKMITALAALEAGVIDKKTSYHCPGHLDMGGHRFHCWKRSGHGHMNVVSSLAQSCDVFFYEIASLVGIQKIAAMARRFGLGQSYNLDISGVRPGLIPTKEWKRAQYGQSWRTGETVLASIGQGYIQTTPLQLATMTSRLINGGVGVLPTLTDQINYHDVKQSPHNYWPSLVVEPEHLAMIKKGMDHVVNHPTGTAKAHRIENPAMAFGGKTGTAQVRRITKQDRLDGLKEDDMPWRLRHHALFVGYAPLSNPDYVCAVVVEHGGSGSASAAPIAKELLLEAQKRDLKNKTAWRKRGDKI